MKLFSVKTSFSLNQSDFDGIYSLTTALWGDSSERKELNNLIDLARENPNGAESLPRSDCRFITTKLDKTYIAGKFCRIMSISLNSPDVILLDSGLNCIYIISGDEATMIPDTFENTGVEFAELKSLVCDDLGNMIVIDSANDQLQIIDIRGVLIGSVKVKKVISLSSDC